MTIFHTLSVIADQGRRRRVGDFLQMAYITAGTEVFDMPEMTAIFFDQFLKSVNIHWRHGRHRLQVALFDNGHIRWFAFSGHFMDSPMVVQGIDPNPEVLRYIWKWMRRGCSDEALINPELPVVNGQ